MATKLTLDPNADLFTQLKTNPPKWWELLRADQKTYIDIRKDNTIDIYFNGGAILGKLCLNVTGYEWQTHYKYLINSDNLDRDYIKNTANSTISIDNITLDLDKNRLKTIKQNIKRFYPSSSEKGIQSAFICQENSCFIDSEFAFNDSDNSRIDMVWVDVKEKKIVFVELKKPTNEELFNGSIIKQLTKYNEFATKYKVEIEQYYKTLFKIKKELDILPKGLENLADIEDFTLETKPLLVVSKCKQDWINKNSTTIDNGISNVSLGAYYYGSTNHCDIIPKPVQNRHIF